MDENKPGKVFKLVVDAMHSLAEERGSTPKEIVKFISTSRTIDRQMLTRIYATLKRGVDGGHFRENAARFSLGDRPTLPQARLSIETTPNSEEEHEQASRLDNDVTKELENVCKCVIRKRSRSKRRRCSKKRSIKSRCRKRSSRRCARKTKSRKRSSRRCARKRRRTIRCKRSRQCNRKRNSRLQTSFPQARTVPVPYDKIIYVS